MNTVIETIKRRRSIRTFLPKPLAEEDLSAILDAGIHAPSGHNDQPWFFTVIRNKAFIDYMSSRAKEVMAESETPWIARMGNSDRHILYNAPAVIIVSGRRQAYSPLSDCSAAIQNMLLAAESLNIGSVWVGLIDHFFTRPEDLQKLNLPDSYQPFYAVCLGYKAVESAPAALPKRNAGVIHYWA